LTIMATSGAVNLTAPFKRLSRTKLCPIQGEADGSPLNLIQPTSSPEICLKRNRFFSQRGGMWSLVSQGIRWTAVVLKPARPALVLIDEGHEHTRAMYAFALSAAGFEVVAIEDNRGTSRRRYPGLDV